jgi:signal transduction histidine kinase
MNFLGPLCSDVQTSVLGLFDPSVAPQLLYYSYVPIIVASLLIAFFVFLNNRKSIQARLLLTVTILFVLWVLNILIQWVAIHDSVLMFAWQLTALIEVSLYLSIAYFAYVFFFKKDLSYAWKVIFSLILVAIFIATPTTLNVLNFDNVNCQGNNGLLWNALYALEPAIIIFTFLLGVIAYRREKDRNYRRQILLLTIGLAIFESLFFLSNYYGELTKVYEFNFWGPLGMFFFIVLLGYSIVQFKAFNVKLLGAQALVTATVLTVGSEYFFVESTINYWLVSATLLLTIIFGFFLVKSVQREVLQRERIEALAKDLEKSNEQQVTLIHFITHQIKGFVTTSRNIFSMALEGDFGPLGDQLKPMVQAGFDSDTKGVATIQEILNAANIKSGKVTFKNEQFDLKALIEEIVVSLKGNADAKGLELKLELGSEPLMLNGDRGQLTNAFKNLIDNSIKYTPKGEVDINLTTKDGKIVYTQKDTGVGITAEDMQNLFTEGGHGKESTKVNVESTGFGLYIVKNIIEAHKGKVWAHSDGAGKGSTFTVELPA